MWSEILEEWHSVTFSNEMKSLLIFLISLQAVLARRSGDQTLNFLVLGDWGGQPHPPYTTEAETSIAAVMGKVAASENSQFTLALGDNFYDTGVKNVNDPRFNYTFENVYTAESLQTPWYVICGNHDHYGNCSAQIAYTKVSKRWNFPDYYYSQVFDIPGSSKKLAVVFIDTVLLAGVTHPTLRSLPPVGPASTLIADTQWDWINQTLSQYADPSANVQWTIVVGHYPVWSVAEHGPTDTLVQKLKPLLEKYNVTAYMCGHDHNLQHITDSGVQYYVTGAGHLIDPSTAHRDDIPHDSLKYYYGPVSIHDKAMGGFALVNAAETTLSVTYIDYKGDKLYTYTSTNTK